MAKSKSKNTETAPTPAPHYGVNLDTVPAAAKTAARSETYGAGIFRADLYNGATTIIVDRVSVSKVKPEDAALLADKGAAIVNARSKLSGGNDIATAMNRAAKLHKLASLFDGVEVSANIPPMPPADAADASTTGASN